MMEHGKVYWAEAPATSMVFGEHAVLKGYPAMVMALDYSLKAYLKWRSDRLMTVQALGSQLIYSLDDYRGLAREFKYIAALIDQIQPTFGFDLRIDSRIDPQVGLGSSAALIIALIGVFNFAMGQSMQNEPIHQQALNVLHKVQGRGSGADLAASLHGGVIVYKQDKGEVSRLLPPPWTLELIYSGYKTPTGQVLEQVSQELKKQPKLGGLIDEMGLISQNAIDAWQRQDIKAIRDLCIEHQRLMRLLKLTTPELDQIDKAIRDEVLAAKISGSGLGDSMLSWGICKHQLPFRRLAAKVRTEGLVYGTI